MWRHLAQDYSPGRYRLQRQRLVHQRLARLERERQRPYGRRQRRYLVLVVGVEIGVEIGFEIGIEVGLVVVEHALGRPEQRQRLLEAVDDVVVRLEQPQ